MPNYDRISPTAILVAAIRAKYTDLPYAGDIYGAVKGMAKPGYYGRMTSYISRFGKFFPRSTSRIVFLEARYLSVNSALREVAGNWAIVEVASGLSARGLEWSKNCRLYIETDLPDMLHIKNKVLEEVGQKGAGLPDEHHKLFPLNAMDYSDWEHLGSEFFSGEKMNIAVVHEGLASYLSQAEKDILRDNIHKFLVTYASDGLWITPDFYTYGKGDKTPVISFINSHIESRTGRKYHHFASDEQVSAYLREGGFDASCYSSSAVFNQLSCLKRLDLDRDRIFKIVSTFKTWLARPV
jgi:O-methyltransferase involved in polyketide biosynthesis